MVETGDNVTNEERVLEKGLDRQGRIKASRGPRPKYFAGPHIHTFIGVPTV